jgi:hypothetical protein
VKIKGSGTFIFPRCSRRPSGVVLVLTLMILIVLAAITYQLTLKLADRRRADDYLIYYQGARYACDSALKYALATAQIIDPNYADRALAPDFSDMFRMTDDQIDEVLQTWADQMNDPNYGKDEQSASAEPQTNIDLMSLLGTLFSTDDANSADYISKAAMMLQPSQLADANQLVIPGPYGAPWPLVTDPVEFEIGSAKVTITIEDENAKLPLVWMTDTDKQLRPTTLEVLRIFSGWYGVDEKDVAEFQQKLDKVAEIKPFTPGLLPTAPVPSSQTAEPPVPTPRNTRRSATQQGSAAQAAPVAHRVMGARAASRNYTDYARLMGSSLVDATWLTAPVIEGHSRQEYPMKYLGVWGSTQVNINTAPRHVLEAAFTFGGDADKIADALIEQRHKEPFKTIDDFRRKNLGYGAQIQRAEKYITTTSTFFTIRITATNGPATCTATAAVLKQGGNITKIAAVFE